MKNIYANIKVLGEKKSSSLVFQKMFIVALHFLYMVADNISPILAVLNNILLYCFLNKLSVSYIVTK